MCSIQVVILLAVSIGHWFIAADVVQPLGQGARIERFAEELAKKQGLSPMARHQMILRIQELLSTGNGQNPFSDFSVRDEVAALTHLLIECQSKSDSCAQWPSLHRKTLLKVLENAMPLWPDHTGSFRMDRLLRSILRSADQVNDEEFKRIASVVAKDDKFRLHQILLLEGARFPQVYAFAKAILLNPPLGFWTEEINLRHQPLSTSNYARTVGLAWKVMEIDRERFGADHSEFKRALSSPLVPTLRLKIALAAAPELLHELGVSFGKELLAENPRLNDLAQFRQQLWELADIREPLAYHHGRFVRYYYLQAQEVLISLLQNPIPSGEDLRRIIDLMVILAQGGPPPPAQYAQRLLELESTSASSLRDPSVRAQWLALMAVIDINNTGVQRRLVEGLKDRAENVRLDSLLSLASLKKRPNEAVRIALREIPIRDLERVSHILSDRPRVQAAIDHLNWLRLSVVSGDCQALINQAKPI